MDLVVVVNKAQMGSGDVELGRKILATCLRKLSSVDELDAVVFYNAGVTMATKESPAALEIGLLRDKGVELLLCGTCVEHFGIGTRLLVDHVSNMDEILTALRNARKVITL